MTSGTKINHKLLRELGRLIFIAAGSSDTEAAIVSDHLVDANLKGHDSHGVVRISKYVDWVKNKELLPNQHAQIIKSSSSIVSLDGCFGYGQVIGKEAMDIVIERTKAHGFCATTIRNSVHLGRIGEWPEQLAKAASHLFTLSIHLDMEFWWRRMAAVTGDYPLTRLLQVVLDLMGIHTF